MTIAEALIAISESDLERAHAAAVAERSSLLGPVLAEHLERLSSTGIYEEPSAFEEFIGNGGNVELYAQTIDRLADIHAELKPETVLDVGCGDGRVTAAVVQRSSHVHLLEPSTELLHSALRRFLILANTVTSSPSGIVELLDQTDLRSKWDLVQSTFAMHTITPDDRADVLRRLRRRAGRFVFVEFDVPSFEDRSIQHAEYAAERYERGLSEYVGHPKVVTDFLMPVLVGQFDPNGQRHTFEQPISAWTAQLKQAGWATVAATPIADYWWAPAVLIEAMP